MKYVDLEDKAARRIARHMGVTNGESEYALTGPRSPQGDTIRQHIAAERIVSSPELIAALADIESAESRIRKTKLSGLSVTEIRKFEASTLRPLIRGEEDRRKKHEIALPIGDATRRLLQLEESKLRHSRSTESEAIVKLNGFEKRGYSREDLLVLGAISDRTSQKGTEVRETIPEHLADPEGVKIVAELERLVEMQPGQIGYYFAGSPVQNVVHVADLLADTAPTIQDLS